MGNGRIEVPIVPKREKALGFYVEVDLYDWVVRLSKRTGQSQSEILRMALQEFRKRVGVQSGDGTDGN